MHGFVVVVGNNEGKSTKIQINDMIVYILPVS